MHWTMCDLADAHEALDIQYEIEQFNAVQNKPKK